MNVEMKYRMTKYLVTAFAVLYPAFASADPVPIDAATLSRLAGKYVSKIPEIEAARSIVAQANAKLVTYGGTSREIIDAVMEGVNEVGSVSLYEARLNSTEVIRIGDFHHIKSDLDFMVLPNEGPGEISKDRIAQLKQLEIQVNQELPGGEWYKKLDFQVQQEFFGKFPAGAQHFEAISTIPISESGFVTDIPQLVVDVPGRGRISLSQWGIDQFVNRRLDFVINPNYPLSEDTYGQLRSTLRWIRYTSEYPEFALGPTSDPAIRQVMNYLAASRRSEVVELLQQGDADTGDLGPKIRDAVEKIQIYSGDSIRTRQLLDSYKVTQFHDWAGTSAARIFDPLPNRPSGLNVTGLPTLGSEKIVFHGTVLAAAQNIYGGAIWSSNGTYRIGRGQPSGNLWGNGFYVKPDKAYTGYGEYFTAVTLPADAVLNIDYKIPPSGEGAWVILTQQGIARNPDGTRKIAKVRASDLLDYLFDVLRAADSGRIPVDPQDVSKYIQSAAQILRPDLIPGDVARFNEILDLGTRLGEPTEAIIESLAGRIVGRERGAAGIARSYFALVEARPDANLLRGALFRGLYNHPRVVSPLLTDSVLARFISETMARARNAVGATSWDGDLRAVLDVLAGSSPLRNSHSPDYLIDLIRSQGTPNQKSMAVDYFCKANRMFEQPDLFIDFVRAAPRNDPLLRPALQVLGTAANHRVIGDRPAMELQNSERVRVLTEVFKSHPELSKEVFSNVFSYELTESPSFGRLYAAAHARDLNVVLQFLDPSTPSPTNYQKSSPSNPCATACDIFYQMEGVQDFGRRTIATGDSELISEIREMLDYQYRDERFGWYQKQLLRTGLNDLANQGMTALERHTLKLAKAQLIRTDPEHLSLGLKYEPMAEARSEFFYEGRDSLLGFLKAQPSSREILIRVLYFHGTEFKSKVGEYNSNLRLGSNYLRLWEANFIASFQAGVSEASALESAYQATVRAFGTISDWYSNSRLFPSVARRIEALSTLQKLRFLQAIDFMSDSDAIWREEITTERFNYILDSISSSTGLPPDAGDGGDPLGGGTPVPRLPVLPGGGAGGAEGGGAPTDAGNRVAGSIVNGQNYRPAASNIGSTTFTATFSGSDFVNIYKNPNGSYSGITEYQVEPGVPIEAGGFLTVSFNVPTSAVHQIPGITGTYFMTPAALNSALHSNTIGTSFAMRTADPYQAFTDGTQLIQLLKGLGLLSGNTVPATGFLGSSALGVLAQQILRAMNPSGGSTTPTTLQNALYRGATEGPQIASAVQTYFGDASVGSTRANRNGISDSLIMQAGSDGHSVGRVIRMPTGNSTATTGAATSGTIIYFNAESGGEFAPAMQELAIAGHAYDGDVMEAWAQSGPAQARNFANMRMNGTIVEANVTVARTSTTTYTPTTAELARVQATQLSGGGIGGGGGIPWRMLGAFDGGDSPLQGDLGKWLLAAKVNPADWPAVPPEPLVIDLRIPQPWIEFMKKPILPFGKDYLGVGLGLVSTFGAAVAIGGLMGSVPGYLADLQNPESLQGPAPSTEGVFQGISQIRDLIQSRAFKDLANKHFGSLDHTMDFMKDFTLWTGAAEASKITAYLSEGEGLGLLGSFLSPQSVALVNGGATLVSGATAALTEGILIYQTIDLLRQIDDQYQHAFPSSWTQEEIDRFNQNTDYSSIGQKVGNAFNRDSTWLGNVLGDGFASLKLWWQQGSTLSFTETPDGSYTTAVNPALCDEGCDSLATGGRRYHYDPTAPLDGSIESVLVHLREQSLQNSGFTLPPELADASLQLTFGDPLTDRQRFRLSHNLPKFLDQLKKEYNDAKLAMDLIQLEAMEDYEMAYLDLFDFATHQDRSSAFLAWSSLSPSDFGVKYDVPLTQAMYQGAVTTFGNYYASFLDTSAILNAGIAAFTVALAQLDGQSALDPNDPILWILANGMTQDGQFTDWAEEILSNWLISVEINSGNWNVPITATYPIIYAPPVTQSVNEDATASMSVYASGTAISYQWQYNGTNLVNGAQSSGAIVSGATTTNLTISGVKPTDSGNYSVVVYNVAGAVSGTAGLMVNAKPSIRDHPTAHQVANLGGAISLNVSAIDVNIPPQPLTYQWKKDGLAISGQTLPVLYQDHVMVASDAGTYTVEVTNAYGTRVSDSAKVFLVPRRTAQNGGHDTYAFSCGLSGGGFQQCTGYNGQGQLSDGSTASGPFVEMAAGGYHACGTTTTGKTYCWGDGHYSQYGPIYTEPYYSALPIQIISLGAKSSVAAGGAHTCVASGAYYTCFGDNTYGQAPSTLTAATAPIVKLDAGWNFTCGLLRTGKLECWGDNSFGQKNISSVSNAVDFQLGWYGGCATLADSTQSCWGTCVGTGCSKTTRGSGAPLITTQPDSLRIAALGQDVNISAVASGTNALTFQWKFNNTNLLNGSSSGRATVSGATTNALVLSNVQTGDAGNYLLMARSTFGSTQSDISKLRIVPRRVQQNGNFGLCSITGGTASCAGDNSFYTTTRRAPFSDIISVGSAVEVTGGKYHACALRADGHAFCWGDNHYNQLTPTGLTCVQTTDTCTSASTGAREVQGITDIVSVATGGYHTCVVRKNGEVYCWGDNHYDQLTQTGLTCVGSSNCTSGAPRKLNGMTNAVKVDAGSSHTCALSSTGSVTCWGNNTYGQINVPAGLTNVTNITAGWQATCATRLDGTSTCWGATTTTRAINAYPYH